jgi:uncharacterized protein YdeI (YjbR/CyaY-like superfamily)
MVLLNELYVKTREEWRAWLEKNHTLSEGVWLIYYKKHTGKPRVPYNDAVEEALCFGWIDSLVKKLDEERYCQKFTPRNENSEWSDLNKQRVQNMIDQGLMTEAGLLKIRAAKKKGKWDKKSVRQMGPETTEEFEKALKSNEIARINFEKLSPSYKGHYLGWIASAKRPETRERRIREAISLLEKNQKLGMK